jgi:hypothetical protein
MREHRRPTPRHRTADVAVRPSRHHHGRSHQESPRRPSAFADRARAWGFGQAVMIDAD